MSPQPGESEVSTNTVITIVFSEPVTGVSNMTFSITPPGTGTPVGADIFYNNDTHAATLQPWRALRDGTVYNVEVGGDIEDYDFNRLRFVGWDFTTVADMTPPTVVVFPPDGTANVDINFPIYAMFSEEVAGVTPASLYVEDASGTAVPGSIGFGGETTMTWTPQTVFAPQSAYTVHLTSAITDFAGHPLAGTPLAFAFTTGNDNIAPSTIARTPAPGDLDIPTSISISVRFSEPMTGASTSTLLLEQAGSPVAGTVTYFSSTRVARLTPSAPLTAHTTYTVKITSGLTDIAGNPMTSGVVTWTFTTGA